MCLLCGAVVETLMVCLISHLSAFHIVFPVFSTLWSQALSTCESEGETGAVYFMCLLLCSQLAALRNMCASVRFFFPSFLLLEHLCYAMFFRCVCDSFSQVCQHCLNFN